MSKLERRKNRKLQFKINNKLKKVLTKDIFISPCCYCRKAFLISDLTIEHLVPLCLGGTNELSNVDLACGPCNQSRGRDSWFLRRELLKSNYKLKKGN